MANQCLTSLVVREMEIKKNKEISTKIAKSSKTGNIKH